MKIKNINIKGLHKEWNLSCAFDAKVNILSGINGAFKSTLLRLIRDLLLSRLVDKGNDDKRKKDPIDGADIEFLSNIRLFYKHFEDSLLSLKKIKDDELLEDLASQVQSDLKNVDDKSLSERILKADIMAFKMDGKKMPRKVFSEKCKVDFISTFDMPQLEAGLSYLDLLLVDLERDYAYYLSDLAKSVTQIIVKEGNIEIDRLEEIYRQNNLFLKIMNEAFSITEKNIDTSQSKLSFKIDNRTLDSKSLSSGEKQLLIIMLTVLLEKNEEYILLMDEPEISMHFEWQRKLISNIISLNPNCQIILTSHSPAIIMDGWEQFVLSMDDIRTKIK